MARSKRKRTRPWDEDEADDVKGLLTSGSGADEVCAVTDCAPEDLDPLCMEAFGISFAEARQKFQTVGKAMFNKSLFEAACSGNAKAMDMYARTVMGFSPGSPGRPKKSKPEEPPKERLEL